MCVSAWVSACAFVPAPYRRNASLVVPAAMSMFESTTALWQMGLLPTASCRQESATRRGQC
jgi:hypothetical protein